MWWTKRAGEGGVEETVSKHMGIRRPACAANRSNLLVGWAGYCNSESCATASQIKIRAVLTEFHLPLKQTAGKFLAVQQASRAPSAKTIPSVWRRDAKSAKQALQPSTKNPWGGLRQAISCLPSFNKFFTRRTTKVSVSSRDSVARARLLKGNAHAPAELPRPNPLL